GEDRAASVLADQVQQALKFGESDPRYQAALRNLATFYRQRHNYAEAESLYRRAVAVSEKDQETQRETATSLNELGLLLQEQARFSDAQAPFERALVIRKQIYGPNHPLTTIVLNNLASVYSSEGHYSEAETLDRQALAIWERLGKDQLNL